MLDASNFHQFARYMSQVIAIDPVLIFKTLRQLCLSTEANGLRTTIKESSCFHSSHPSTRDCDATGGYMT